MTISGKGYNIKSDIISKNLEKTIETAKADGNINEFEMNTILKTATSVDKELSAKEVDLIKTALKDQGGLVSIDIENANKFSFKIKSKDSIISGGVTSLDTKKKVDDFMKTERGKNITTSLGIPNPPVTKLDKSSVAFNLAMLEKRDEYKLKYSQYLINGTCSLDDKAIKKLKDSGRDVTDLIKRIILENPDMSIDQKTIALRPSCGYGVIKTTDEKEAQKIVKENAVKMKGELDVKTQSIYEAMGGKGKAASQYVAAVGDGGGTTGVALESNLCIGYFQYGTVSSYVSTDPNRTGTDSKNDFDVKIPLDENLEIKLGAYGFDGEKQNSDFNMKIGDQVELKFKLSPGESKKGTLEIDDSNLNEIKKFLSEKGVTLTDNPTKENIIDGLKQAGITIDLKNTAFNFDYKKYGGLVISNHLTGTKSSDERQVQISTNGSIAFEGKDFPPEKLFEARDLYDVAKFTAEKSKMTDAQKRLIDDLVKNLNLPNIKSPLKENIDLNKFFNAIGGSVNPETPKDLKSLTKEDKNVLRSTSAIPGANGKIDIVSYTDPDPTGLKDGSDNDFHDYFNKDVGSDLKKTFIDNNVYLAKSGENNNTLSTLRTLSFIKLTVIEKYKDLQPPLSADDFAKMTISVKVKDQDGKEVTINAKLSDVPPK